MCHAVEERERAQHKGRRVKDFFSVFSANLGENRINRPNSSIHICAAATPSLDFPVCNTMKLVVISVCSIDPEFGILLFGGISNKLHTLLVSSELAQSTRMQISSNLFS